MQESEPDPTKLGAIEIPSLIGLFGSTMNQLLAVYIAVGTANLALFGVGVQTQQPVLLWIAPPTLVAVPATTVFFGRLWVAILMAGQRFEREFGDANSGFFGRLFDAYIGGDGLLVPTYIAEAAEGPQTFRALLRGIGFAPPPHLWLGLPFGLGAAQIGVALAATFQWHW
jgi:hypothetical protein